MEMNGDALHHHSPSRRFCALSWLIVDSCRLLMISPCCVLQKDRFAVFLPNSWPIFHPIHALQTTKGASRSGERRKRGSRPQCLFVLLALKHFTNDPANRQGHKHIQNPLKHVGPGTYGSFPLAMTSRNFSTHLQ